MLGLSEAETKRLFYLQYEYNRRMFEIIEKKQTEKEKEYDHDTSKYQEATESP